jgi:hypothetical protein
MPQAMKHLVAAAAAVATKGFKLVSMMSHFEAGQ